MEVSGSVSGEFDHVKQVFAELSADLLPGGGALSVYYQGALVVDLWTGEARPGEPWQQNTRAVLMSATKGAATLCCAILVERGLLDLDQPVAYYWPEFGVNGKSKITVAQILDHSAGVITLPEYQNLLQWDGSGWNKTGEIQSRIAQAKPEWAPGSCHGYHALTCCWMWDRLIQVISGDTSGEFFRKEISDPLDLDFSIGSSEEEISRTAWCTNIDMGALDTEMRELLQPLMDASGDEHSAPGKAFFARDGVGALHRLAELMNNPKVLATEVPAANGTATPRSLARMYALLANGGELDGLQLLNADTIAQFCLERRADTDVVLGLPSSRGLGFMLNKITGPLGNSMGPNTSAFGHSGAGGQIGFADPRAGIGFGFVRNALSLDPMPGMRLIDALYRNL